MLNKIIMTILTTIMISFGSIVSTSLQAQDCYTDGYLLGTMEADSFCEVWERMYNEDVVVMPYRMNLKLCSAALVNACKQGMAQQARSNYPLCTWLVRSGWTNRQGDSATTAWAAWQRGSCNIILP